MSVALDNPKCRGCDVYFVDWTGARSYCRSCVSRIRDGLPVPNEELPRPGDYGGPKLERVMPFGSCSICKVAFGRTTAKVEIDKTEYCFPCWDELKRTGTVARYRRPVAPELYPEASGPAVKLVEMRPKRLIKMEE